jgi:protein-tyrosine phosphatase
MAKPRGLDWLDDEMIALKDNGVDVLVCALTPAERDELGLADEAQAACDAGLQFVSIPITDLSVPDIAVVAPTLRHLAERLREGAHIVTHCRFGIGRSSLIAAAVLVLSAMAPDEAWHRIEQARGHAVPDTTEQRQWTATLLDRHGLNKSTFEE